RKIADGSRGSAGDLDRSELVLNGTVSNRAAVGRPEESADGTFCPRERSRFLCVQRSDPELISGWTGCQEPEAPAVRRYCSSFVYAFGSSRRAEIAGERCEDFEPH